MFRLKACCALAVALSVATASVAEAAVLVRHHHRHWRPAAASDVITVHARPAVYFPAGFISGGVNFGGDAANGLSGDDAYGPPFGFHGGLARDGVVAPGFGGPFDRVSGCGPGYDWC